MGEPGNEAKSPHTLWDLLLCHMGIVSKLNPGWALSCRFEQNESAFSVDCNCNQGWIKEKLYGRSICKILALRNNVSLAFQTPRRAVVAT